MKSANIIKLLLVDDHPVVRDGLRRIQELDPSIQIVGEAGTMLSAVESARRLDPQIILMDVRLPTATASKPVGRSRRSCRKRTSSF